MMSIDAQETLMDRHIAVDRETDEDRNSVICIDSDKEEDERIRQESRPTRLVVDRRRGRPRDAMNRFLNTDGTNVATRYLSQPSSNSDVNGEDDDITILGEMNRTVEDNGLINSNAEFVDLEAEPELGASHQTAIVVHRPNDSENLDFASEDDGVEIVEERTTASTVRLNLPGGETIIVNASPSDRPIRRSFEWQQNLPQSRRQMLRRSARRARQLLFEPEDSDSDDNSVSLPRNVMLYRQQEQLRQRQSQMRRQREQRNAASAVEGFDPALADLRRRINSHPPNVRSAFDHAQSLHEFRSILQNIAPLTLQECDQELIPLFTEYRSRIMERWAEERVRTNREEARANRNDYNWQVLGAQRRNLRPQRSPQNGSIGESLTNYIMTNGSWDYSYDDVEDEARTQSIMNMIQEREEMEHDIRTKKFMEKTKPQQDQILEKSLLLPDGYSASFDTEPKVKMDVLKDGKMQRVIVEDFELSNKFEDIPVCCLCGVELGVGIPDDFDGINKVDRGVSFECLVYKYGFHCPFQSLLKPSQLDRDLSKRTFVASCGHTFCGRCFARIDNARTKSRMAKKKLAELKGSSHPDNYGPKTCPATNCKACLRSRGKMREAFF